MSTDTEIQGGGRALTPQREVVLRVVRESAVHLPAA
jgi:Fe2+ or Zn2+ uptake regulation protein